MTNRKINFKAIITIALITLAAGFTFTSCYTPSPLYGTWTDNTGSTIRIQSDNTFSAKIKTTSTVESYQGTYSVVDNVLVFEIENPSYNVVSEWDVRGAMLYIEWVTSTSEKVKLTLYHTAR